MEEPEESHEEVVVYSIKDAEVDPIVVHTIQMGYSDDPDLLVAQPIYEWQQSEEGKWIMEHSVKTPVWRKSPKPYNYYYSYDIVAYLTGPDLIYWKLKYE